MGKGERKGPGRVWKEVRMELQIFTGARNKKKKTSPLFKKRRGWGFSARQSKHGITPINPSIEKYYL